MELEVVIGGISQLLSPVKEGANIFQTLDETLKAYYNFLDGSDQFELRTAQHDTITDLNIPKYDREYRAMSCKEDVNRYCQFTLQGLALLCLLDNALKKAHTEDLNSAVERRRTHHPEEKKLQHFTPKALLSPAEEKKIHTLLQFVVALGVFPFLVPGADNLLRHQLGEMAALIKKCDGDDNIRALFLYHHCRTLSRLFTTPVIGPSILTHHLSIVLVALMQICYAPREQQQHDSKDASHLSSPSVSRRQDEAVSTLLSVQQCTEELNRLLDRLHQPLVVRELLSLQKFTFRSQKSNGGKSAVGQKSDGRKSAVGQKSDGGESAVGQKSDGGKSAVGLVTPRWLQRACGRLLSSLLLKEDGVHKVLLGIFDSIPGGEGVGSGCQGDWMRVQAVAKIISQCPSQASSQSHYYSIIAPQLLELLGSPMAASVQVVAHTISIMMRQQPALARKHLVQPLTQAIMQLSLKDHQPDGLGGDIELSIKKISRLSNFTEPSSPLLKEILPLLPIFFELWRASNTAKNKIRSDLASVIIALLNSLEPSTIIHLLRHLCGMPLTAQATVEWDKVSSDITIEFPSEGCDGLCVVNGSGENWDVEKMEGVGKAILEFLWTLLKSKQLIGKFFIECFRFVIAVLCTDVDYQTQISSVQSEIKMQRSERMTSKSSSTSTSSALLDLENKQCKPSQAEAFHRSLALYLTASLSENKTSEVLEQADTADLLEVLSVAIDCHAHLVTRKKCDTSSSPSLNSLLLVQPDLDQMLGGPITLSIALGYLSALLGGAIRVEKEHRPVFSGMLESLEIISTGYPEPELSALTGDLRMCIATLGAVWTAEMKEWKKMGPGVTKKVLIGLKQELQTTGKEDRNEVPIHACVSQLPTPEETDNEIKQSLYQQALIEARDAEIPVKGHGLASLARLVETGDKEALTDSVTLIEMFRDSFQHSDSYVYLPAITGLVALASKQPIKVLTVLCEGYALFSKSCSVQNKVDSETGKLKVQSERHQLVDQNKQIETGEASLELRLKLGEALVRVCRECGEMLPHYSDMLLAAVLCNVRDPHPLIRASALSNLAEICQLLSHSFGNVHHEVLSCVTQLLLTDPTPQVQQAALLVLNLLLKGLSHLHQTVGVLGDSLRDVYHLLKRVEGESHRDELTRTHARAALGQLDHVMREWIFPQQTFSKKITVL